MATRIGLFIKPINVMFNLSKIEKMTYAYNILPRDFRLFLTYYFDFLKETEIGFIYRIGTMAGLGMICFYGGNFVFKLKTLSLFSVLQKIIKNTFS
jgi:hypothetical protein